VFYSATMQITTVKISSRSFEAEGDLEEEIRGIIDDARLEGYGEEAAKLSSINIMSEPHSAIQIHYVPMKPGIENLEPFLERVNYIADELEKIKIVEKITDWLADPYNEPSDAYLQQKLPLPEA